jgi:thiol-disulfide isomerase/thioredoxin
MERWHRRVFWAGLLLAVLVLAACEESPPPLKLQIGQTVPLPLDARDLFNRPAQLGLAPDKLLMVNVWATWCAPCRHEMPSLQRLAQRIGADRLQLVGLSVDHDEHVVREYLIENNIHFPSLLDRGERITNGVFGVRVFPSTFFIAPDGRLVHVVEGWREWDSAEVFAEIEALLPPKATQPSKNPQSSGG